MNEPPGVSAHEPRPPRVSVYEPRPDFATVAYPAFRKRQDERLDLRLRDCWQHPGRVCHSLHNNRREKNSGVFPPRTLTPRRVSETAAVCVRWGRRSQTPRTSTTRRRADAISRRTDAVTAAVACSSWSRWTASACCAAFRTSTSRAVCSAMWASTRCNRKKTTKHRAAACMPGRVVGVRLPEEAHTSPGCLVIPG